MTFKEWIIRHKGKDTPLGNLADDVSRDKDFPEENTKEAILDHLTGFTTRACPEAVDEFKHAWKSYQAYMKRHSD